MPYPSPAQPIQFVPLGLFDTIDGSRSPAGACISLQNLIHDITTPQVWVPRPAATQLTDFTGFNTPVVVSCAISVGVRIYGMIGTARNAGKDEPFCYNTATSAFEAVSGVTGANTPTTQPTSGSWTPPTMAVVGTNVLVTHPGFSGGVGVFFGVFDISTPGSPAWSSANTTTHLLPSVPTAVQQYRDRAWFACANILYFTDPLTLAISNADQTLTLGDSGEAISTLAQQGLVQTTGGIIQALIAFKNSVGPWQITGDYDTLPQSDLVLNGPVSNVGCSMPRSAVLTPAGIFFAANDGIRILRLDGAVSDKPIPDLSSPFANAVTPSRVAAGYNAGVYRISGTWILPDGQTTAEYWYDFRNNRFSGPHTSNYDVIVPVGSSFVFASNAEPAALYQSNVLISTTDTFTEFGSQLGFVLESAILPQRGDMAAQAVVETTVDLSFFTGVPGTYTIQMVDPGGNILGQATTSQPPSATIWGAFVWGSAPWAGVQTGFQTYNVDWDAPIVFKRASISIFGDSFLGLRVGAFAMRTESLGYMNVQNPP